ncbi:MAG: PAS domain S-box protein, partial [Chloroflexi bacterium]|nr:PAS domain S-box protein [Chloroflexota bacterium]
MSAHLSVLIVEDSESDAQLIVRMLKKADYDLFYEQVETAEQMRAALERHPWDIVISDYKMPQFSGIAALKLLQEMGRDIPFIITSGTIGEETAVAMMRAGAQDYLTKGNLARLVPAVERELSQAEIRRKQGQINETLRASELRYQAVINSANDAIISADSAGTIVSWNPGAERIFGHTETEARGQSLQLLVPAGYQEGLLAGLARNKTGAGKRILGKTIELEGLRKDGCIFPLELSLSEWQGAEEKIYTAIIRDITERKQAEALMAQQSEQLRLVFEASQRLNRTLDLAEIYQATCDFMSIIATNDGMFISSFDHETQLITCRAYSMDNNWLDVSSFPQVPLEPEGKGTQSRVIRSGQSMLINDYQALAK